MVSFSCPSALRPPQIWPRGLFRYRPFALPYKNRDAGAVHLILEQEDQAEKKLEARYDVLARIGLVMAVVGTLLQAWSTASQGKLL